MKSNQATKKNHEPPFQKILPPQPQPDLAELFSDDEDIQKHQEKLQLESLKPKKPV